MGSKKSKASPSTSMPFKVSNKLVRKELFARHSRAQEAAKRDVRLRRKRAEGKDPQLREQRVRSNIPQTLDRKRIWDDMDLEDGNGIGLSVDLERLKRKKSDDPAISGANEVLARTNESDDRVDDDEDEDEEQDGEDQDSMISFGADSEADQTADDSRSTKLETNPTRARESSPTQSTTSTNLNLMPEALAAKFPSLFTLNPDIVPKILITTSFNSTLHTEAQLLTGLFPNSIYIPRSQHRYSHKYSIREISSFATNRKYTAVIVLNENLKRPSGIDFVHLPQGPMFHFSISNWIEGKKLPGHGNPTNHWPELILNNFRTPLGLLTAHLFRSMFPPQPEFQGRQVVTLHNQRDFIFVRRHRYVFREKKETEKVLQGSDGKAIKGAEGIRAGLQELGPRFTMKLRRIDKQIQRSSGQEWEWKGKTDKIRTKFQL